ncbi:MAG: GspH/FimT family pseudopilin [Cyanobacteria bacterium P01_E01_bin.34]
MTNRNLLLRSSRGFSTLEVIATLVIAGILAGVAGFAFFGQRNTLGNATEEVANALKYSRSVAIATTSACRVNTTSDTQLAIECSNTCTAAAATWAPPPSSPTLDLNDVTVSEVNGAALVAGGTVVCFDSRGAADTAASLQLSFADNGVTDTSDVDVLLGGAVDVTFN